MKRRVITALLVAFAIWPLVHHALVRSFHIDPWKFAGWSMYIVPQRPPLIEVSVETRHGWQAIEAGELSAQALQKARAFSGYRRIRGDRLPPDDLARFIMANQRHAKKLKIRIYDFSLDSKTARVRLTPHEYLYAKGG